MLSRPEYKIIFLRRKNLLDAAISNAVGHQTKKWHKHDYNSAPFNLKPIKIKELKDWIAYVGGLGDTYQKFLEKNRNNDFMLIYYEDLYSEEFNKNKANLKNICDYLQIGLPKNEAIIKFMTPANTKINYQNVYKNIPNYDEVVKSFNKSRSQIS